MSFISECRLIELPKIKFREGNITAVNNSNEIPFDVKRVFYLYDIPGGGEVVRGGHAHYQCKQFLVAVAGSFDVKVKVDNLEKIFQLNRPNVGLYIPEMVWAEEFNFSSGAICLVLASRFYDRGDYVEEGNNYLTD